MEDLRVPLHGGLPVVVDAASEGRLRSFELMRVRWGIVDVVGVLCDAIHVDRVGLLPPVGQLLEVLEDIVLSMPPDPGPILQPL